MLTVLTDRTATTAHEVHCSLHSMCIWVNLDPWTDGQMDRSMLHGIWWFFETMGKDKLFFRSFFFWRTLKLFVHSRVAITNVSPSIQLLLVLASFTFLGSIFEARGWRWRWNQFSLCVYVWVGGCGCACACYLSYLNAIFSIFILFVCSIHFHFIHHPSAASISPQILHTIEFSVYSFDHYENRSPDTHWIRCDCFDIMFLPFYLSYFMNAPLYVETTVTRTTEAEPWQNYGNRPTWENNIVH